MNYLDFVEDYKKNKDISLFEKIMVSTRRVIDLYENSNVTFENKDNLKPVSCAVYELNKGYIKPVIKSQEEAAAEKELAIDDSFEDGGDDGL